MLVVGVDGECGVEEECEGGGEVGAQVEGVLFVVVDGGEDGIGADGDAQEGVVAVRHFMGRGRGR